MRELGVNTGSIDMIYTKDNEYVFLEVNPTGQFGMTSVPCNYPIDLEVAKFLKNSLN
jgi:D-alanine-D-alanine ligase-like ATP-grasp enzyme